MLRLDDKVVLVTGCGSIGPGWGKVAHAALFLASDEARYVTGEQMVVDGGFTAATR